MAYNTSRSKDTATFTKELPAITLTGFYYSVQYNVEITTPVAGAFTVELDVDDIPTSNLNFVSHQMETGLKVRVSSATTLPDGLASDTDYFVIKVDADKFKLASSLQNAKDGVNIEILDEGTGVHTVTPTEIAGAVVKLQESVDGTNWYDISGKTHNITAGVIGKFEGTCHCGQIRPYLTMTAGQLNITINSNTK